MTEWQIGVLGAFGGLAVYFLYSIDKNLTAILFVLRQRAGLDRDGKPLG